LGRIVAVFACVFGIFALSLLIYYVQISLQMDEWETYAYQNIVSFTGLKTCEIKGYFKTYIKYKFTKLTNLAKLPEMVNLFNSFRYNEVRLGYIVRSRLKFSYTPLEFYDKIIDIWHVSNDNMNKKMCVINKLYPKIRYFSKINSKLVVITKNSKTLMFKLYNLFKIYNLLHCSFRIESI
jgi:hypothetical protein